MQNYVSPCERLLCWTFRVNRRRNVVTNVSITFDCNETKFNICAVRNVVQILGLPETQQPLKSKKLKTFIACVL